MTVINPLLLAELCRIDGLEVRDSPVAGGKALFHRGREFAHFHHDTELDLRLTRKVIQAQGLTHPADSAQHPGRSPSSAWMELRLAGDADVPRVVALVRLAIAQL